MDTSDSSEYLNASEILENFEIQQATEGIQRPLDTAETVNTPDISDYLDASELLEDLEIQLEQTAEPIQRPLDTPDTSEILEILEELGIQLEQEVVTRHQQELTEYIQTNFR